ncbi:putative Serine/threonine protein kinase [Paratrimastix pyriformis]|uniref:Serine/threonine protein kinase n=1 Tax=Paratrimastix pyriformis TaxID=342808 RepID=A0ABQ8U359_9EUKA|nr:putative Serine/threonine protein kinase [Paratrimastix pyriformis]
MLPLSLRIRFALHTAQGCAYLHSFDPPIIHRDLKTGNLLVDSGWNVKVSDFGLARVQADQTMSCCGTAVFCAPEVLTANKYSEKADVFSFAMPCCVVVVLISAPV